MRDYIITLEDNHGLRLVMGRVRGGDRRQAHRVAWGRFGEPYPGTWYVARASLCHVG